MIPYTQPMPVLGATEDAIAKQRDLMHAVQTDIDCACRLIYEHRVICPELVKIKDFLLEEYGLISARLLEYDLRIRELRKTAAVSPDGPGDS